MILSRMDLPLVIFGEGSLVGFGPIATKFVQQDGHGEWVDIEASTMMSIEKLFRQGWSPDILTGFTKRMGATSIMPISRKETKCSRST